MDLTPDVLRGIEFRRKGRGYDADEVDEFRQKVEVGVGELQARLREATTKLEEAETRARESEERSRTSVESDETIQRTLLLAQRTADAAVKEAEETAGRKVAEAEAEAERLLTEARNHRERAIAEAEAEVRQAIDVKRAELLDELTTLERARDSLAADVDLLERHLQGQRGRIEDVRTTLTQLLEQPQGLAPVPAPALSGVEVPAPEPAPTPVPTEPAIAAPDGPVESVESVFGEVAAADEATAVDDWETASEEQWADTPPPPPPPPPPGLEVAEDAWATAPPPPPPPPPDFDLPTAAETVASADTGDGGFGGLSGPAFPDLESEAEEDNPWLAELADHEAGDEDTDRSRFGRRR